jgi:hypothetical protein
VADAQILVEQLPLLHSIRAIVLRLEEPRRTEGYRTYSRRRSVGRENTLTA